MKAKYIFLKNISTSHWACLWTWEPWLWAHPTGHTGVRRGLYLSGLCQWILPDFGQFPQISSINHCKNRYWRHHTQNKGGQTGWDEKLPKQKSRGTRYTGQRDILLSFQKICMSASGTASLKVLPPNCYFLFQRNSPHHFSLQKAPWVFSLPYRSNVTGSC